MTEQGISYVCWGRPGYPDDLKEIYDPPLLLFYRGELPPSGEHALAVVGTRHPSLAADRARFCPGAGRGNREYTPDLRYGHGYRWSGAQRRFGRKRQNLGSSWHRLR